MTPLNTLITLLALSAATGCSKSPTAPTPGLPSGPRSGTWVGTLTDPSNGSGAVRMQLDELATGPGQSFVSGTWSATFGDASNNATGSVTGAITGPTGQLSLQRTVPLACASPGPTAFLSGSFFAQTLSVGAATMTGDYQFQACSGVVNGRLDLRLP